MRTPEQVRWDFVQQWLKKAHQDFQAATVLFQSDLGEYEIVGFHAQQAAEKYIKAFLVRHQIEFPKTHNIALLRQLVAQQDPLLGNRLGPADALTPYGVEFRYPGDLPPVSEAEGAETLRLAEHSRDAVLVSLEPYLHVGRPR